MRDKMRSEAGSPLYRKRKAIVEPVFGVLKQQRNLREFRVGELKDVTLEQAADLSIGPCVWWPQLDDGLSLTDSWNIGGVRFGTERRLDGLGVWLDHSILSTRPT
jgi:hypothetical protein